MSTYQHVVDGMGDVAAAALEAALGDGRAKRPLHAQMFGAECLHGPVLAPVRRAAKRPNPQVTAEREGFEPSDPVSQVNSLAVSPIRPLSHLSRPPQSRRHP